MFSQSSKKGIHKGTPLYQKQRVFQIYSKLPSAFKFIAV